jgi:hypothetical protein
VGTAYLLLQKILKLFRQATLAALLLEQAQLSPELGDTPVIATSGDGHCSHGASADGASQHCWPVATIALNAFAWYLQHRTVVWTP